MVVVLTVQQPFRIAIGKTPSLAQGRFFVWIEIPTLRFAYAKCTQRNDIVDRDCHVSLC